MRLGKELLISAAATFVVAAVGCADRAPPPNWPQPQPPSMAQPVTEDGGSKDAAATHEPPQEHQDVQGEGATASERD